MWCHFFPSKFFGPKSPKAIVGEPFCVSEMFWYQKFLDNRSITILSFVFVSQCQKICGEASNDSKKLGHPKKFMHNGGDSRFSVENFWSHSFKKHRGGTFLASGKVLVRKKFLDKKGLSRFSVKFFWSQIVEKHRGRPFSVSELFWFQNFLDNTGITVLLIVFVSQYQKIS